MKRISEAQVESIREVVAERPATYPPAALEKDLHLTEILRAISSHRNNEVNLTFGGGTSLVKAYRLFDRMSEDLDFKFQTINPTNRSQQQNLFREFRKGLYVLIESLGYQILDSLINSEGQHFVFELKYENAFEPIISLRPIIKLEFFSGDLIAPGDVRPISSLLDIALDSIESKFSIQCTNIDQIAGEKVLGFLNRYYTGRDSRDPRLVRHIHDVYFISNLSDNIENIASLFPAILTEEINRFKNQLPDLAHDPIRHLTKNLELLITDHTLPYVYDRFVSELTLSDAPAISEAKANFLKLANSCVRALSSA